MSISIGRVAGIPNASQPLPNVVTGGQPNESQVGQLKAAGVEVLLDLRDPREPRPFNEPAAAQAAGLEYVNVPVVNGGLSDGVMDRILDVLRQSETRPTVMHCGAGSRTGGPLIAHLILDHGYSEEEAVEEAMKAGLRGGEVLSWGISYARRKQAEKKA